MTTAYDFQARKIERMAASSAHGNHVISILVSAPLPFIS